MQFEGQIPIGGRIVEVIINIEPIFDKLDIK
jgi:hypothetical protein